MRSLPRALAALGFVGSLFGLRLAQAEPPPGPSAADMAAAETLFKEAKQAMADGRYAEACAKFHDSLELDRGIGAMLFLADCYEKNGQTASAWAQFLDAAYAAKLAKQPEREAVARRRAGDLEPQLAHLIVELSPDAAAAGVDVKRDGTAVGRTLWGTAVPVDPGTHTIEVSAPGRKKWQASVEVPPQATVTVPAPLPEPEEPPPPAPPPPPAVVVVVPPRVDAMPKPSPGVGRTQRVVGLVVTGVGVVGLGIGAGLGIKARSYASQADQHCRGDACDPTGLDLDRSAGAMADGSTASFVLGGAAVAAGLAVFFTAAKGETKAAWRVAPSLSATEGGVRWQLAW